jgi:hypothetical protein
MTAFQAAYVNGSWHCYATDDAIRRRFVGCSHRMPASAIAHTSNHTPFVSPLATPRKARQPGPPAGFDAPFGAPLNGSEALGSAQTGLRERASQGGAPRTHHPGHGPLAVAGAASLALRASGVGLALIPSPQPGSGSLSLTPDVPSTPSGTARTRT